ADFRVAEAYAALADVHVLVLDDDARAAGAPGRVEGAQVLTAEQPFDARPAERPGHHAVELAAAAEWHRPGRRSEIADDAGEQLIAFLPVAARHLERQARAFAVLRRAAERDERAIGGEAPLLDRHVGR